MRFLFACVFMLFSQLSYGLDATDVQLIDKFAIIRTKVQFHEDEEWSVAPDKMDQDELEYGQYEFKDLTNWKEINQEKWFDLREWQKSRKSKDTNTRWRTHLRNYQNAEIVARVIKCIGYCRYFHGIKGISAHHQTVLREGDEFTTEINSYAWLALMDGSLVRVSPKTSLTLQEVNLTPKVNHLMLRLNYGHINFQSRLPGKFETLDKPETDLAFYPLMYKTANREYYSILEYRKFDEVDRLVYAIAENAGHVLQYKTLNEMLAKSFEKISWKDTQLLLITPNATLNLTNTNGSVFYAINDVAQFKITDKIPNFIHSPEQKISQTAYITLREYNKSEAQEIEFNTWYEVDTKGKEYTPKMELEQSYATSEAFLARIPTIHLARELLFSQHSLAIFDPNMNKEQLARYHRYYLWDNEEDIKKRLSFLSEYTRRIETTNLQNLAKVFKDVPVEKFDKSFYSKAMQKHYFALRNLHNENQKIVRELNDNEYYLWLLKNAKE